MVVEVGVGGVSSFLPGISLSQCCPDLPEAQKGWAEERILDLIPGAVGIIGRLSRRGKGCLVKMHISRPYCSL